MHASSLIKHNHLSIIWTSFFPFRVTGISWSRSQSLVKSQCHILETSSVCPKATWVSSAPVCLYCLISLLSFLVLSSCSSCFYLGFGHPARLPPLVKIKAFALPSFEISCIWVFPNANPSDVNHRLIISVLLKQRFQLTESHNFSKEQNKQGWEAGWNVPIIRQSQLAI